MGNWRTVNMTGRMKSDEAKAVIKELSSGDIWDSPAACFEMTRSLAGLNQWVKEDGEINAVGNLAERDFDNDDIERGLSYLASVYPSLELTLHSGSNWESLTCSATFRVKDGRVEHCAPEVDTLQEISPDLITGRMMKFLS